ncbi:CZB domain-containing protein [Paracidovorax anthurii]|uniref:Chemoreceptor zinc-binding protein n=1 Tax=Paracidovorax anthurii TaxID=78229 RepID=A0A328ZAL8_9BURK|nr:CZB domain-containing protein [Paracidovorax anthurii]RAR82235.1 chemoreceptor zinc-binding protein [Paracidovorax anthurii]
MGFFSRLFPPRADGLPALDDWTSLPDSNASELVVAGDEAAKLLAEIDIDAAIASHARWVSWLEQVLLHGARDERLRPEAIRDDTCSELGQWLHGPGRAALGHLPAFDMMQRRHRYFHQQAADLVIHAEAGDERQAQQAFKRCHHASRQVVMLLQELKRGLGREGR